MNYQRSEVVKSRLYRNLWNSHLQVMDDHWENEVTEYGAVNITGFRIVDHSRKIVRDFTEGLRRMDPRFKGTVSVSLSLSYATLY